MADNDHATKNGNELKFGIMRIYLKDASFETPNSPQIFLQDFQPAIDFQLGISVTALQEDVYEVLLTITVTAKDGDTTGFLVEIQQAGVFHVSGNDAERVERMLRVHCTSTLFPYARANISDIVSKGGFPALDLTHVNFKALYEQELAQKTKTAETDKSENTAPVSE